MMQTQAAMAAIQQAGRRLGHSYRCIARVTATATRTVWLSVACSRSASRRRPWRERTTVERRAALEAWWHSQVAMGCACKVQPTQTDALALEPGQALWGADPA